MLVRKAPPTVSLNPFSIRENCRLQTELHCRRLLSLNPFSIRENCRLHFLEHIMPTISSQSLQYQGKLQTPAPARGPNIVRVSIPSVSGKTADVACKRIRAYFLVSIPSVSGKTADKSAATNSYITPCLNPFSIRENCRRTGRRRCYCHRSQSLQYQGKLQTPGRLGVA